MLLLSDQYMTIAKMDNVVGNDQTSLTMSSFPNHSGSSQRYEARHSRPGPTGRSPTSNMVPSRPQRQRQRTRAAMACGVCRGRKTKCDGRRPACSYCQRTRSDCHYDDIVDLAPDMLLSQNVGSQILDAIEQLTQLVKAQSRPDVRTTPTTPFDMFSPSAAPSQASGSHSQTFSELGSSRSLETAPNHQSASYLFSYSEGLDTILNWHVFPKNIPKLPVDNGETIPIPQELPPMSRSDFRRLRDNYYRVVHTMNPILDLATLDASMDFIAENGFDYSMRTCLVALVSAIGALCQESNNFERPGLLPVQGRSNDADLAYRYWSVASKRLGPAMCENTIESAQCLCLTGIWYMCNLQPLQAWKHFTMAGNSCHTAILSRQSLSFSDQQPPESSSQAIEHSIFHTAYKSELEIRYELAIPGSVSEHLERENLFPIPPMLLNGGSDRLNEEVSTWYYYLSDIAARHLINRIVNAGLRTISHPNEAQIKALLRDYELLSTQLRQWHESLPHEIRFFPLSRDEEPPPYPDDPLQDIMRLRYILINELLCRPFVQICLSYTLDVSPQLMEQVTAIASLGLQYCSWDLQCAQPILRLDHGTWTGLRIKVAHAMIIFGAARALHNPSLNAASSLDMPKYWRNVVEGYRDKLSALSEETRGGVAECYRLLCWGLNNFDDFSNI